MISRRLFNTGLASTLGFLTQKNPLESFIPKTSLNQISSHAILESTELWFWESRFGLGLDDFTDLVYIDLKLTFHFNKKITENSYTAMERTVIFQGSECSEANNVKKTSFDDLMTSFKIFCSETKQEISPTKMVVGKHYNIEMYNYLGKLVCTYVNFFYKSYGDYKYRVENS